MNAPNRNFTAADAKRGAERLKHQPQRRLIDHACKQCGEAFVSYKRRSLYCSKSCVWKATKGPEFNAQIARIHNPPKNRAQRGTGTKGYVKRDGRHEHRVVAEQMLGRALLSGEIVHHRNGDKHDNRPENLEVMTQREHMLEHGLAVPGKPLPWEPWKYSRKAKHERA